MRVNSLPSVYGLYLRMGGRFLDIFADNECQSKSRYTHTRVLFLNQIKKHVFLNYLLYRAQGLRDVCNFNCDFICCGVLIEARENNHWTNKTNGHIE